MADPGADAGEVHVDVLPNADRFATELRAKLASLPNVKVAVIPDTSGFRGALRTSLASLPATRVKVSPDTSTFRTDLRTRLATITGLKVRVEADLTASSIATLRAALGGIVAPTITIDVDITAALANIATLQVALSGIVAPTVNADVDIAAAMARVAALQAALAGLTSPTINPNIGGNAGRAGANDAGAYAATFRAVVTAALRNLPTPTIGAATGPAEQAVRDLRISLTRLANEHVGVTITTEQAQREIVNLRADIVRLRAMSPVDVDVDANVRAAELALSHLEAQLDAIGRDRTATVRVNDGGSISRMQLLVGAIAGIGPAAIPAAAAAAAALVSIANAAVVSVAGIGVAVLALSGIGGAVKALNAVSNERAKTQATLAGQDKTLASGADQVRAAVASLANTRANAERSVANAERDHVRAQRDALDAQLDLTRAREEAAEALQDLDAQVKGNALAIRQATLDVADAEKALAQVRNLDVNDRRRVDAQLAYDEARQQLDDLTLRQGRLAKEKAAGDKAGVEGSEQVVAAQRRIVDTQEKVRDAELGVADARRQAAFSITQAQQAVVSAQRAAATSAKTTAGAASTAVDELRAKLEALSPAGQGFARFIFGLRDTFLDLRRAAETGFLPGLQRGLEAILVFEPKIVGFVAKLAAGFGNIAEAQLRAFGGTEWRAFFNYLDDTAVPTLDAVVTSAFNVARGLGNVIVAFAPFTASFNSGLVSMTERFAAWSAQLSANAGFRDFLAYVSTRGPQVLETVGRIVDAALHFLVAVAPIGDVVLTVLRGISITIAAIPVGVIVTLYAAFLSLKVASFIATVVTGLGVAIRALATGSIASSGALGRLTGVLGGPFIIAIGIAVAALATWATKAAEARARVDSLSGSFASYADALRDGITPASKDAAESLLRQNKPLRDLIDLTTRAGISQEALIAGLNGDRTARDRVIAAIDAQIAAQNRILEQHPTVQGNTDKEGEAAGKLKKALQEQRQAYVDASTAAAQAAVSVQGLTGAAQQQSKAAAELQPRINALQNLYDALSDSATSAAETASALRQVIEAYTGTAIAATEAEEGRQSSLLNLSAALRQNGSEFDLNRAKTDDHRRAILASRDALQEALLKSREAYLADVARGLSLKEAKERHDANVQSILAGIPPTQRNSAAVQQLVADYGSIPLNVSTDIKLTGAAGVLQQLKNLKIAQLALDRNMSIADASAVISGNQGRVFAATGGYISGPGGPRDDLIPAMLSNGEFVQQTAAVQHYGPRFMHALNQRKIPRQALPHLAGGGQPVDWPYNVDVTDTDVPTLAQIKAKLFGSGPGFGTWPSGPGAQRGDSGVWRSIVALIRSTGPASGSFGNAFRPGDPLWHGSGRAVDWMGFNQDSLAGFLAARRPLELIHRTNNHDYAYTRGVNKGSFNNALMQAHRNHIHIAMCDGGLVDEHDHRAWAGFTPIPAATYDTGGVLPPGATLAYNGTGGNEYINTADQIRELAGGGRGDTHYHLAGLGPEALGQLKAHQDREAIMDRPGRPW